MHRKLASVFVAMLVFAILFALSGVRSMEEQRIQGTLKVKVERAAQNAGVHLTDSETETLVSLLLQIYYALSEMYGIVLDDLILTLEVLTPEGTESTRMYVGSTGEVVIGYGLRHLTPRPGYDPETDRYSVWEQELQEVLRVGNEEVPFTKFVRIGKPAYPFSWVCDGHGWHYLDLREEALTPDKISAMEENFAKQVKQINKKPEKLAEQLDRYRRGEDLDDTIFEVAPYLEDVLRKAGVDQGGRIIIRGFGKIHVQLLVALMYPDVDIMVNEDQLELKRVIASLKNPVTPSKEESILFIALPVTEERFNEEASGEGGRTFVKTLIETGYTWETYYDRIVRPLNNLVDQVRAYGVTVQMDATSESVRAVLTGTEYNNIAIVTNNVGDAIEMADGLWPMEDLTNEVRSLPEERKKGIAINLIANDGFELARQLVKDGTNLSLFNVCKIIDEDSIEMCIGPFLISSVYTYSKTIPGLDGGTPLDLLYNRAIKEFIEEVLSGELPLDIFFDLRAIPRLKSELDKGEYAFG